MTLRQAAQQALEAWFRPHGINYVDFKPYMDALRAALAEPEQPHDLLCVCGAEWDIYSDGREELVTAPAPRKPLTDHEIGKIAGDTLDAWSCARAIEKAHGIGEQP